MGVRRDKGKRIANLITGKTGLITEWDPRGGFITERPYGFTLSSDRSLLGHSRLVKTLPADGPHAVIRFDGDMDSVHDAWITFRIDVGLELLAMHDRLRKEG